MASTDGKTEAIRSPVYSGYGQSGWQGGERKTGREHVTTKPVKDSDRIKAMQQIDTLTGTNEQREIDKQQAMSEYDALYKRIIGNRVVNGTRNIGDDSTDGSDIGRRNDGHANATEVRESAPPLRDRVPGGKGSRVPISPNRPSAPETNSESELRADKKK